MELLSKGDWFDKGVNLDLRLPLTNTLSFKNKLTIEEWQELINYIYQKCINARSMK